MIYPLSDYRNWYKQLNHRLIYLPVIFWIISSRDKTLITQIRHYTFDIAFRQIFSISVLKLQDYATTGTRSRRLVKHSLTWLITVRISCFVKLEPDGRHRPLLKSRLLVSSPQNGLRAKTGCKCIGFQMGRASIFSFSSAIHMSILHIRPSPSSIVIALSQ